MLKNLTISAEENVLRLARERARREHKTLNGLVRQWLDRYIAAEQKRQEFRELMRRLGHVRAGGTFTRDEMNER